MAKVFTFAPDDRLDVVEDTGSGRTRTWSIPAAQITKHRPDIDAEMTPAQRRKCDDIATAQDTKR